MTRASESNASARDQENTPAPAGSSSSSGGGGSANAPATTGGGGARQPLPTAPPGGRQPLPGPPPGRPPGGLPPPPGRPGWAPAAPRRPKLTDKQLWKLVRLLLALVALGALLGWVLSLVLPAQYAARTSVQYTIAGENTGEFLKTDRNLTTQVVLMTSRNVLQPVADANGISVTDLTGRVSATILGSSDIIQVEVRSPTRQGGIDLANAITKRYLEVADASGPKGYLKAQLDDVRAQQGTPGADAAALTARAAALQSELDDLNLTTNQSSVIVPAYSVEDVRYPDPTGSAITGGVCGLVLGLVSIITLARRWTRG
jgi:hypothetical protein